jgi:hypothetical protein
VAHDFNNILTLILCNCGLLIEELEPGHPLRSDVGQIYSAVQHAAGLTHQLLAFSRRQLSSQGWSTSIRLSATWKRCCSA